MGNLTQGGKMAKNSNDLGIEIKVEQGDFKSLKTKLDEKLMTLKDADFINDETGIKATLGSRGVGEIISNVKISVENGFTFAEHFAAAMDLQNLFKKARFLSKSDDVKHNDPFVKIYRFKSLVSFKNKQANAILMLKEWKENGKRIYALKLENLEKL